jgi:type II secretory pathway pseudopilin PulG
MNTAKLHLNRRHPPRGAFTLVELLVVIAIIIVLVGLMVVAVPRALSPAYEAQARTDMAQLNAAVQAFQTKFQVSHVPSRIILCKNYLNYFNPTTGRPLTGLHQDSLDYLKRLFPRIDTAAWRTAGIDWSGDGIMLDPPMGPKGIAVDGVPMPFVGFALEGEQCLAFFLGGIPQDNGDGTFTATGFFNNPGNPAQPGGDRLPPFFEFKSNRLIHWTPPGQPADYSGTAPGFPSYLDTYGKTPYAYFSSYRMSETQSNGYNRYVNYSNPYLRLWPAGTNSGIQCGPVTTDCQALPFAKGQPADENNLGVFPYAEAAGPGGTLSYLNPRTFQIISAGKDLYFGQGTAICTYPGAPPGSTAWFGGPYWTPQNTSTIYPTGLLGGGDDITNFHDRLLGVQ